MNHARILWRTFSIDCDVSLSLGVSRNESKKCERRLTSRLFIASQEVCDGDTLNLSSVSEMET